MTDDEFEDPAPPDRIQRDGRGRPLVRQPDGSTVAYTRCTTYVGCLEDQFQVQRWRNRMVAIGLADRPDLLLQVGAHRSEDDKQELNRIVDAAAEAGKASAAANIGTALHKLTEKIDKGEPTGYVPEAFQADLAAFRAITARFGLRAWMIEPFTVCDPLKVGGTPDRVYELPGLTATGEGLIGDTKTGRIEYSPLKFAMQEGVYAHSTPYVPALHQRVPYPVTVSLKWGVVVHLPQGTGICELYKVDIEQGWEAVQVATVVRDWRNRGKKLITKLDETSLASDEIDAERAALLQRATDAIAQADSTEKLRQIWAYAVNACGLPEDALTLLCRQRQAQLEGSQR